MLSLRAAILNVGCFLHRVVLFLIHLILGAYRTRYNAVQGDGLGLGVLSIMRAPDRMDAGEMFGGGMGTGE